MLVEFKQIIAKSLQKRQICLKSIMAESFHVATGTKEETYVLLLDQLKALYEGETNLVANLANTTSALKMTFNWFWIGFYLVQENQLILGPFQGTIACTRIPFGKGVCGTAWQQNKSLIVPNVDAFPGHIACSSMSKSEIVIPIRKNKEVVAILDVDSDLLDHFDTTDELYLNQLCEYLSRFF